MSEELQEWRAFTEETVTALLEDGSNAQAPHTIEYHIAGHNFDQLEKVAVEAFKLGFEVTDAEEFMLDDGGTIFSFDAVVDRKLDIDIINEDCDKLIALCEKFKLHFDGWGTYFVEADE